MNILVAGGAGFIGSHTSVELLKAGYSIVIADNFSNSKPEVLDAIRAITQRDFKFYQVDLTDKQASEVIFKENQIDAVIHFAGYKAVGESVAKPMAYYHNNLMSTLVLCELMSQYGCKKMIFSSSATVYGDPEEIPITENCRVGQTTNPYGTSKLFIERILSDIVVSDPEWSVVLLRYFNPIGAHPSGLIGENPNGIPNNLMPYIVKVANGELPCLNVFGNDYPTPDGTGVRDYIHVVDLALGHIKAVEKAAASKGVHIYNLGTGHGYSVLEIVDNFEKANGIKINYRITARRPGDIPTCYADTTKAKEELGWEAQYGIEEMCRDAWNYVKRTK